MHPTEGEYTPQCRERVAHMSTVAMGSSWQLSTQVLNLMHTFRHEVFVKRLKWSLPLVNGVSNDLVANAHSPIIFLQCPLRLWLDPISLTPISTETCFLYASS